MCSVSQNHSRFFACCLYLLCGNEYDDRSVGTSANCTSLGTQARKQQRLDITIYHAKGKDLWRVLKGQVTALTRRKTLFSAHYSLTRVSHMFYRRPGSLSQKTKNTTYLANSTKESCRNLQKLYSYLHA